MVPFAVHATRSVPERFSYRVGTNQCLPLMEDDVFRFSVRVHVNTTPPILLLHSPYQTVSCRSFFGDGQFLRTMLTHIQVFIESIEEIVEAVKSDVRRMFPDNGFAFRSSSPALASQPQQIPLWLELTLFDTSLFEETEEESMQCFRTVPASNEAIQRLLKKPTVVAESSCCTICMEELDANAECRTMPCDHVYHERCIVSWLKINHVCPVCRYSLPTLEK